MNCHPQLAGHHHDFGNLICRIGEALSAYLLFYRLENSTMVLLLSATDDGYFLRLNSPALLVFKPNPRPLGRRFPQNLHFLGERLEPEVFALSIHEFENVLIHANILSAQRSEQAHSMHRLASA